MSYIKLAGQKDKPTNTNMANQLSIKKLQETLEKASSNKIKGLIRQELQIREKVLNKQAKKLGKKA